MRTIKNKTRNADIVELPGNITRGTTAVEALEYKDGEVLVHMAVGNSYPLEDPGGWIWNRTVKSIAPRLRHQGNEGRPDDVTSAIVHDIIAEVSLRRHALSAEGRMHLWKELTDLLKSESDWTGIRPQDWSPPGEG